MPEAGRDRRMTTATLARKCIACGHDNASAGDSCSACGSSLDLKLCRACEAINGAGADRCHACGDVFVPAGDDRSIEGTVLTVLQEPYVSKPVAGRRRRFAMFLAVLAAMLTLPLYLFISGIANRIAPAIAKEQQPDGVPQAKTATPATTNAGTGTGAEVLPIARTGGPVTGVTHTRRADAPLAKTLPQETSEAGAPEKTAVVPQRKARIKTAAVVAAQPPSRASAPAVLDHPYVRVTHTRATPADAATAVAATNSKIVAEPSASAGKGRSPDCDERVAALGFCK